MAYDQMPSRENRDDLCDTCKVPEHDTCGNDPSCSCCADTMEAEADD